MTCVFNNTLIWHTITYNMPSINETFKNLGFPDKLQITTIHSYPIQTGSGKRDVRSVKKFSIQPPMFMNKAPLHYTSE